MSNKVDIVDVKQSGYCSCFIPLFNTLLNDPMEMRIYLFIYNLWIASKVVICLILLM